MNELLANHGTDIAIGVGVAIALWFLWKLLKPKPKLMGEGMAVNVRCPSCKWQGVVTKYNAKCRRCGNTELQELR